jgi:hypothetical protein
LDRDCRMMEFSPTRQLLLKRTYKRLSDVKMGNNKKLLLYILEICTLIVMLIEESREMQKS